MEELSLSPLLYEGHGIPATSSATSHVVYVECRIRAQGNRIADLLFFHPITTFQPTD